MKLEKVTVEIDNLLLDPNNPRFADISDESLNVPIQRFADKEIQKHAYNKMLNTKFDVVTLADSIESVGFLPVDNIVARKLDDNNFVVIEGNRRTAALKYILYQYELGQSLLTEDKITDLKTIDILIVDNIEDDAESIGKIIQGIRNVSGIKEWDAYQKAQFISEMYEKDKDPVTISKMIGMSVRDIRRYYNTYNVMLQFKKDEEFGNNWKPSYFSYFDEVLKRPVLREYLGWDLEKFLFTNTDNLTRFYSWIIPNEEGEVTFSDHKELRNLVGIIKHERSEIGFNYLDDNELQKAIRVVEVSRTERTSPLELISKIKSAIEALKTIMVDGYERDLTEDDIDEIFTSIEDMKRFLSRVRVLRNHEI